MLKTGDKVCYYRRYTNEPVFLGEVVAVTKTLAKVRGINGNIKKLKNTDNFGRYYEHGDNSKWDKTAYCKLTDEVKKEIEYNEFRAKHQNNIVKYAGNNIHEFCRSLSDSALVKISEIITEELEKRKE